MTCHAMNEEDLKLKIVNRLQHRDDKDVTIISKDFKAVMVKIHQQAITIMFGTNAITEMQAQWRNPTAEQN